MEIAKGVMFLIIFHVCEVQGISSRCEGGLTLSPVFPLSVLSPLLPPLLFFVELVSPEEDFYFFSLFYSHGSIKVPQHICVKLKSQRRKSPRRRQARGLLGACAGSSEPFRAGVWGRAAVR